MPWSCLLEYVMATRSQKRGAARRDGTEPGLLDSDAWAWVVILGTVGATTIALCAAVLLSISAG